MVESKPGGRRPGQGRETAFKEKGKSQLFAAAVEAFRDEALADLPEIYRALRDAAKGLKVLAVVEWKGARRILIDGEEKFQTSSGEPCWIYTLRPDTAAAKLIVEHVKGRASTQPKLETETTIHLVHAVPRPGRVKG